MDTEKLDPLGTRPLAVITGATRGIGRCVALMAAQKGYDIAFCYRKNVAAYENLIDELKSHGADVYGAEVDVSNEANVQEFFQQINNRFKKIDLLVNNAGITGDGLLPTLAFSQIQSVIDTNLLGTILSTREALKYMLPCRQGVIVNVSSVAAHHPNPGQSVYAATKGAIEAFTRAMAVEVARKNIRVNAVSPGVIKTQMSKQLMAHEAKILDKMLAKSIAGPESIANTILFLANPENSYITGEVIHVDGGIKLG